MGPNSELPGNGESANEESANEESDNEELDNEELEDREPENGGEELRLIVVQNYLDMLDTLAYPESRGSINGHGILHGLARNFIELF